MGYPVRDAEEGPESVPKGPALHLEPEDFYTTEDGLMVFTRTYHLKRGSCCKSGCRHCPWKYRKAAEAAEAQAPDRKS